MQTAGTSLQLLGALFTAAGLLYAWNRSSGRFDQWRDSIVFGLIELRGQLSRQPAAFNVGVDEQFDMQAGAEVIRPGMDEERLHRIENDVTTLLRQAGQVNEATKAAIDEKLGVFSASGKGFAVRDISWALVGIGVGALGNLLSLVDKLST
jgi:hypothetical protein